MTEPVTNFDEMADAQSEETVEALSVTDKFVGILTEPRSTYENIKAAGAKTTDWLIPLFFLIVIILAGTLLRYSNEAFMAQILDKQKAAMQERVESGSMTQEQADQASAQIDSMGSLQKVFASVGVVLGVPIVFFLIALVYWLIIRYGFKGEITFAMLLAVYGLTAYIGLIDQLLAIVLMFVTDNPLATFSPAIFLKPDMASTTFKLLNAINPITIWSYFVLAIGFHIGAKISKSKAYALTFGLWIIWVVGSAFISIPGMG